MPESIGKVFMDLETNYDGFNRQLNNVSGKATGMVSKAFGKLGVVVAGAFAVSKLVKFGSACISLASDLQEVQNVVDVVFGKSASQINNFAKTAINSYGLSELSAKQYASTMGAMLKSMGLSDDAVLNMSQSITALTGDMASFYNLDSETAFQKIRAGISGETEPLKQLGINMSVANMEAYALSKGITKSYQSMTQSEQALLRYNYLLSTTADAQGDFARTSDSWANQTRILSEQFNTLKATLGSAFMSVLTPVVKMLNWVIAKIQIAANYFKAFVEAMTGIKSETSSASSGMQGIADSATEAGDATVAAAKKASNALAGFDKLNVLSQDSGDGGGANGGGVANLDIPQFDAAEFPEPDTSGVENSVNKVKGLLSDLKSWMSKAFAPSIKAWGNAFTKLKDPVKKAFQSVKDSSKSLWKDTLVPFGRYLVEDFVPTTVNSISENLAPVFTDVMGFAIDESAKDFEFYCWWVDSLLKDVYEPALEHGKKITVDTFETIGNEWRKSGSGLIEALVKTKDSIKDIITNLYNKVLKPVWDSVIKGLDSLWDNHLKGLWESIVSFTSKLTEAVLTIWNNFLSPLIRWIIDVFGPAFVSVFRNIWDNTSAIFGNLIDACKNIFKAFGGLLDFITGVFSKDWKKAWEGIKTFFKGIWDAMVNVIKAPINLIIGMVNTLLNGITTGVNTAIRALNKLSFTVPDWVPGIGGNKWGFNIKELTAPKIPYLAKGAIIDQPTLAMVGERGKEAVVPLENTAFADSIANAIMRVLMPLFNNGKNAGQNNGDGNTVIVLKVGEYELGRITVGAINKYHNVVGRVELEV